jgi:hypothetical protein
VESLVIARSKGGTEWAQKLSKYLVKDPDCRTEEDIFLIKASLESCGNFCKNLTSERDFTCIAREATVDTFSTDEAVYFEVTFQIQITHKLF